MLDMQRPAYTARCRCTRLSSLAFNASDPWPHVCSVPAGITALRHLQHLELRDCVTAALPRSLSQMTRLTSLVITQDEHDHRRLFHNLGRPVVRCVFGI